jgi:hypothetical protein
MLILESRLIVDEFIEYVEDEQEDDALDDDIGGRSKWPSHLGIEIKEARLRFSKIRRLGVKKIAADINYRMIKEAVIPLIPIVAWIAQASLAVGGAAVGGAVLWQQRNVKAILNSITSDFTAEEAGELYIKWYKKLSGTDLINGRGTFPVGDPMGGAFMRSYIHGKWTARSAMNEDEFEDAVKKYYGESTMGLTQFGLQNEEGWVDSFNAILELRAGQDAAKAAGKDWRTEGPEEA